MALVTAARFGIPLALNLVPRIFGKKSGMRGGNSGGMTAGGGGMTAGRVRRRGRGFLGGRLRRHRRGRGFFKTIKRIGKKVFDVARDPRTLDLAKRGYDLYKSARSGNGIRRRRRTACGMRRIRYRKMRGRGMAYNSMETAGPLP